MKTSQAVLPPTFAAVDRALASGDTATLRQGLAGYDMPLCGAESTLFLVRQVRCSSVELYGSWDGWCAPVALARVPHLVGWWFARLASSTESVLEYKLKVDGEWTLDPSNPHFVFGRQGLNSAVYPPGRSRLRRVQTPALKPGDPLRDLYVYLPAPYFAEPACSLPVAYWQDGFNVFANPKAPFGSWDLDLTCDALVAAGEVAPTILVGIDTQDRQREYVWSTLDDHGAACAPLLPQYASWLITVVKPLIDKTFRTKPGRQDTAIGGSSLGGIAALWTAWQHWPVFGAAASLSGAFWVGEGVRSSTGHRGAPPPLRAVIAANHAGVPSGALRVYLDSGDQEFQGPIDYASDAWVYSDWTRNALIAQGWDARPEWRSPGAAGLGPLDLPVATSVADVPVLAWRAEAPAKGGWRSWLGLPGNLLSVVGRGHHHDEAAWKLRSATALRFLFPGPRL